MPGHNGGANWGSGAVDPDARRVLRRAKNMPVMLRLVRSTRSRPRAARWAAARRSRSSRQEQKAQLMAEAKEAAAKGPIRFTSPYDFMLSPTNAMTAIGPPWSDIMAYDLNTGDIKWRVPHGGVKAPPGSGIPNNTGVALARAAARW